MSNRLKIHRAVLLVLALPMAVVVHGQAGPAVTLLPQGVLTNLEYTKEQSEQMEQTLGPVISDLENQLQTYQEMQCEGASGQGCEQIKQNMVLKYKELLDGVRAELPEVEQVIESTVQDLGKRLHSEVGKKMTPRELQRRLAEETTGEPMPTMAAIRGRAGGISGTFRNLLQAMSTTGVQRQSQLTLSADIYRDLKSALEYIQVTRQLAEAQWTMVGGSAYFSEASEEMVATVHAVNALIFGGDENAAEMIEAATSTPAAKQRVSRWEE